MAISKKRKRKITVGQDVFFWFHEFYEDKLCLTVMSDEKTNSRLVCNFNIKDTWLYFNEAARERSNNDFFIITPRVVRQAIDFALGAGWRPFEKGKHFVLNNMECNIEAVAQI